MGKRVCCAANRKTRVQVLALMQKVGHGHACLQPQGWRLQGYMHYWGLADCCPGSRISRLTLSHGNKHRVMEHGTRCYPLVSEHGRVPTHMHTHHKCTQMEADGDNGDNDECISGSSQALYGRYGDLLGQ